MRIRQPFPWIRAAARRRYAAVTGAPRGQPSSGVLWVVDIAERKVVGRVAGVGNETYLLALLPSQGTPAAADNHRSAAGFE